MMDFASKPLAVRSFWGLAFRIGRLALMFFASLILARLMSLHDYGTYQYVMSIATLLLIPSLLGLNRLLVREIAGNEARGQPDLARGVMTFGIITTFLMACTVAIVVSLGVTGVDAFSLFGFEDVTLGGAFYLGMIAMIALAMTQVLQGATQGFHHTTSGQLPELIINPSAMLVIVGLGWLVGIPLTANLALTYQIGAAVIGATAAVIFLRKAVAPEVVVAKPSFRVKTWFTASLTFVLINGMYTVNTQADVFMLGLLKGPEFSGLYYPASRYGQLVNLGLVAVYIPLSPILVRQFTNGDIGGVEHTARFAAFLGLGCALPAFLLFWFFGPFFLSLFGSEYVVSQRALIWLCFGYAFSAAMGPTVNTLTMTGYSHQASIGMAVGGVINVILNALLIPIYGIEGAAIATCCSTIIWNVVCLYFIAKLLKINPTAVGPSVHSKGDTVATPPNPASDFEPPDLERP
ncbi:MAG: flippase [Pseudomonadota bacterium]